MKDTIHDSVEREKLLCAALRHYADRGNWRSGQTLDLLVFDPEYIPASATGSQTSGVEHGWEIAEHALRQVNDPSMWRDGDA